MRLTKHLNEYKEKWFQDSVYEFNKLIKKDCKKYLSLIGNKQPLYRGLDTRIPMGEMSTRAGREPMGTASGIFPLFNQWLQKNKHNRRDKNIVIATSKKQWAEGFSTDGVAYYIFPIGNISYTWIKAKDVNEEDSNTGWGGTHVLDVFFNIDPNRSWNDKGMTGDEKLKHMGYRKMNTFGKYFNTDKGFSTAYGKKYEIWIKCDRYYFASEALYYWTKRGELTEIYSGV